MMENKAYIKERVAQAFRVNIEDIIIVKRLLGGLSHFTYHIQLFNEDFTFRVVGKGGNLFVDRLLELENLKKIEPLLLNTETVYFDLETGEKASRFVDGIDLTEINANLYLEEIAKVLKTLHESEIEPANDYGHIDRLSLYESYTNIRSDEYIKLKTYWVDRYQKKHAQQKKVFCHNDAQRANMVLSGKKLYLLDWEYAGLNEFYYDIASYGNIEFSDALKLLDVYLGRKATQKEQNRVKFYRMYQALQWHQVALYKESIGLSLDLGVHFGKLAQKYLLLANQLYEEIKE
jgi:thiamine kinase-like enzyme